MTYAFRTLSRGRGDANLSPTRSKTKKKGGRQQIMGMGGARKKRETGSHVARWPAFAFAYLLLAQAFVPAANAATQTQRLEPQESSEHESIPLAAPNFAAPIPGGSSHMLEAPISTESAIADGPGLLTPANPVKTSEAEAPP